MFPPIRPTRLVAQSGATVNAPTFHYDRQRTGWNPHETTLTRGIVSGSTFGSLWNSPPLDSVSIGSTTYPPHLYATPLYVDRVQITSGPYAGSTFSVVFAATSNDYVYAINAFDVPRAPRIPAGTILWSASLGLPTKFGLDGGVDRGSLCTPRIDVTGTPRTLY